MAITNSLPNVVESPIRSVKLQENFDTLIANDIDLQAQIAQNDADIADTYTKAEVDAKDSDVRAEFAVVDASLQSQITSHVTSSTAHGSDDIVNESSVIGSKVSDALDTVQQQVNALVVSGTDNITIGVYSLTTTGSANAYIGTFSGLTYFGGLKINATINVANTGASTFNLNGLGVKNIKKMSASGSKLDLTGGDLKLNNKVQLEYDGTDFILFQESKSETFYTLPLTPTTSIQSVTDSYDGIIDAEIGGATLYQAVVNGDFANGTAGWLASNSTLSVSNKILSVTGNGGSDTVRTQKDLLIKPKSADKAYRKVRARVTNSNATFLTVLFRDGIAGTTIASATITAPVQNQWYDFSTLVTFASAITNSLYILIQSNYADATTANGKVMEVEGDWTKGGGVFAIPLTGTPYESNTEAQMYAMIGDYFEGLKSTNELSILSRGRNLFDLTKMTYGGFISGANGNVTPDSTSAYSDFIVIKPNTQYIASTFASANVPFAWYDANKVFISGVTTVGLKIARTSPSNAKYVRYSGVISEMENSMLNEGSTALPYEPNKNSILSVECTDDTKFALSKVGTLQDEINQVSGYISAVKRNERYALVSGDITALTTTGVNTDYVTVSSRPDAKSSGSATIDNQMIISGFGGEINVSDLDLTSSIGKYVQGTSTFLLILAKGTYANLATAQTALAGTKIQYQLATPVFIPFENFDQYGINVEGALASHSGYTNVSYEGDVVPDVSVTYAMDLGAGMSSVKDSTATALSLATETYNIIDQDWQSWTPTLTWTGTPPLTPTTVAKYKQIGSTVHFNLSITSTDGNGASQLTITLPVAPKVNSTTISLNAQEKVNTTWTNPLAYILDSGSLIQFRSFSTATDNVALEVLVSGSYEVV